MAIIYALFNLIKKKEILKINLVSYKTKLFCCLKCKMKVQRMYLLKSGPTDRNSENISFNFIEFELIRFYIQNSIKVSMISVIREVIAI